MRSQLQNFERRVAMVEEALASAHPPVEPCSFTVDEFCEWHRLSRSAFYGLVRAGQGPRTYRLGSRQYISREAATDWRREREQASSVAPEPAVAGHDGRADVRP